MEIKILGTGCSRCNDLYKKVTELNSELGLGADIKKVEDLREILAAGVMIAPALVVNGKVKSTGKVPGKDALKKYIQEEI
ncbi:MAG: thioredoxin family protein [Desulfotomaculaceae bacterium]|nr:thioredoxin family protein [Desulfotomaculaceae bacterium]